MSRGVPIWLASLLLIAGCSKPVEQSQASPAGSGAPVAGAPAPAAAAPQAGAPSGTTPKASAGDEPTTPEFEAVLPEGMRRLVTEKFTGDFDEMVKRRLIRIGVTFNRTFYFIDGGTQRGISYEYATIYEDQLNKRLNTGNLKVHIVLIPMPRDMLLPALQQGKIDEVVAQLTVTPERQKLVDFTDPTRRNIDEVVVSGPGAPQITKVEDLSDQDVFVRKTSSYYHSLLALNKKLEAEGKKPAHIEIASESLEDDDLLEMVNAGLVPNTVVDNYLADFWKKVFTDLTVHEDVTLRTGGVLAVAIRKNSPQLKAEMNGFLAKNGLDSTLGAILNKRYLESTKYVKGATSQAERQKFLDMVSIFRRYGDKYKFDYLMMAAQGYQESRLDQNAKSSVGAIGVMQLMPETGKEQKVGDISKVDPNIHAGVKYMRFIRDSFFEKEPMDDLNKGLFTFAAYNAGPGRVRSLRKDAAARGLNSNIWFGNVERVASEKIGRETVTYVANIYKYYVAYKLLQAETARKKAAAASTGHSFE
jgi:membrane-bound lytic murein transglycosylase MltF